MLPKVKNKDTFSRLNNRERTIADPKEMNNVLRKQNETVFSTIVQEKAIDYNVDFFMSTNHVNQDQQLCNITISITDMKEAIKTLSGFPQPNNSNHSHSSYSNKTLLKPVSFHSSQCQKSPKILKSVRKLRLGIIYP